MLQARPMYSFSHCYKMRDVHVSAHVKVTWKVYSVLDTVENGTRLPSAFGHTLKRFKVQKHNTSSIYM